MAFSLVIFLVLGVMTASAQSPEALQVTIPFAFTAHNVSMPAGDYRISRTVGGSGLLAIQNIETGRTLFFLGSQIGGGAAAAHSTVAFRSVGTSYTLADIYWGGYAAGVQLRLPDEPVMTASLR